MCLALYGECTYMKRNKINRLALVPAPRLWADSHLYVETGEKAMTGVRLVGLIALCSVALAAMAYSILGGAL